MAFESTCACGLAYVRGHGPDEEAHARWHSEYMRGPAVPELSALRVIGGYRGLSVAVADRDTPDQIRARVAEVARVARRETPDYMTGYDGTVTGEEDPRLYVAIDEGRAVAMALASITARSWMLRWVSAHQACLRSRRASTEPRVKIARLWVAASFRRRGIAGELVRVAAADGSTEIGALCWQLPFSDAGLAVARRLSPDDWYGDGDRSDLEDVLSGVCDGASPA